jgi:hypothetical protein
MKREWGLTSTRFAGLLIVTSSAVSLVSTACSGRSTRSEYESGQSGGSDGRAGSGGDIGSGGTDNAPGEGGAVSGGSAGSMAAGGAGNAGATAGRGGSSGGGGSNGGLAGAAGGAGGNGVTAGEAGAGKGGGGVGGAGVCECEGTNETGFECSVPLELLCCASEQVTCQISLDRILSRRDRYCTEFGSSNSPRGLVSDCSDGTSELQYAEYSSDNTVRVVFDPNGNVIGRTSWGSQCEPVYSQTCGSPSDNGRNVTYSAGDVAPRTCTPRCELCAYPYLDDESAPRCEPVDLGEGGQGGQSG